MELQGVNIQKGISIGAKPALQDIAQSQNVNPYILAALDARDRPYILELGNIFEALIIGKR